MVVKAANSGNNHYLYVFQPTGDSTKPYIGIVLRNIVNAERNSDVWCTQMMAYFDSTFQEMSNGRIVLDGEWDGVIREVDGQGDPYPDLLGGYVHGNENMDSVTVKLDGKDTLTATDFVQSANEVTLIVHSFLNRYDNTELNVMEKVKVIEITKGQFKISNCFKALVNINVGQFFPIMLPISRDFSQYCIRKGRSEIFDDRTSSHPVVYTHYAQDAVIRQYNDSFIMESSIKASMRDNIDVPDKAYNSEGIQFSYYISASANPAYNKIYYLVANQATLSAGNIINCEATFKFRGK